MSVSLGSMVEKLPGWGLGKIAGSWRNTIRKKHDPDFRENWATLDAFLDAIHSEWDRRRGLAVRPGDLAKDWEPITFGDLYNDTSSLPAASPLTAHGYHVAQRANLTESLRRVYLDCCVLGPLMPAFEPAYLVTWGEPRSRERLQRVVDHVHGLATGSNSTQVKMRHAVRLWMSDISYLRERYGTKMPIHWPTVKSVRFAE